MLPSLALVSCPRLANPGAILIAAGNVATPGTSSSTAAAAARAASPSAAAVFADALASSPALPMPPLPLAEALLFSDTPARNCCSSWSNALVMGDGVALLLPLLLLLLPASVVLLLLLGSVAEAAPQRTSAADVA
jgi:hypothetical protein